MMVFGQHIFNDKKFSVFKQNKYHNFIHGTQIYSSVLAYFFTQKKIKVFNTKKKKNIFIETADYAGAYIVGYKKGFEYVMDRYFFEGWEGFEKEVSDDLISKFYGIPPKGISLHLTNERWNHLINKYPNTVCFKEFERYGYSYGKVGACLYLLKKFKNKKIKIEDILL